VRPPKAPPPAKRPSVTGRALVLAVVLVTLVLSLAVPVRSWFAQRSEIAGLRADVESARERVAALELQKERWDDPAFVAAEARRRLHFVLPGEVGYVTLGSEEAVIGEAEEAAPDEPWYSALWGAVQEADGRDRASEPGD
jgi:cell division protein FtsB